MEERFDSEYWRDVDKNDARDWEYTEAVKAFYFLFSERNKNGADTDTLDAIIDATERGLKIKAFTKLHSSDIKRAREVGEKHAEYRKGKGRFNGEEEYKFVGGTMWNTTYARTLKNAYGDKYVYISPSYATHCNNKYGGQVPFVDRLYWLHNN